MSEKQPQAHLTLPQSGKSFAIQTTSQKDSTLTETLTASPQGTGEMVLEIYVNESQATVNQIVAAVWSALASQYNESGTMGQKLNGAGSAGDPWTTDLSSYNTPGTAGKIQKDALTTGKFLGLK